MWKSCCLLDAIIPMHNNVHVTHRLCHFIHLLRILYQLVHYMPRHFPPHGQPRDLKIKTESHFVEDKTLLHTLFMCLLSISIPFPALRFWPPMGSQQFF
jgi:hypothetical protein